MAQTGSSAYKTYTRGRRQLSVETDFNLGMMFTNGAVDFGYVKTLVNYDLYNGGVALVPRPGLRTSELILPNVVMENDLDNREYHTSDDITIMAAKECVENGETYRQFILGHPQIEDRAAMLWLVTSKQSNVILSSSEDAELVGNDEYSIIGALADANITGIPCTYFTAPLTKIHGMTMADDRQVATIVGTFAFGNSFFFVNPELGKLCKTVLEENSVKYTYETIEPKEIDPSEAVSFGYNMLAGDDAYTFVNRNLAGIIQLTGILPYSTKPGNALLMTPKKNEEIYFRCYFKGEIGQSYKFSWEWRNVGDTDWSMIQSLDQSPVYKIVQGEPGTDIVKLQLEDETEVENLEITFKAPTEEIMIRVQAYNTEDLETVEKAMTVGFDFRTETYGTATNIKQEVYNLTEATGMETWKNRLVLWGVPKDPTILFISDVNEPSYFPYPNNISVYEEPIVFVKAFLDSLLVFTTNTVHQITLSEDGTSWNSVVIQSNLNIEPWDRHLIQVVRNMIFFKSGNYYFMIVPKAQSTTGELALAPISTPIVEFFNHFENNVTELLQDTFDYMGEFELINYYNFLDYEDVHNIYVLYYSDEASEKEGYLHLDMLYNTVSRSWRIHTFEAPHFLFPYKHDATQKGILASTSVLNMQVAEGSAGTMISVKNPESAYDETIVLQLDSKGYDFYSLDSVVVKVYDSAGDAYLEETLNQFTLKDHVLCISNSKYELRSEVIASDVGLQLVALSGASQFKLGSTVELFLSTNTQTPIWGPQETYPGAYSSFLYMFDEGVITHGTTIEFNSQYFELDTVVSSGGYDVIYKSSSNPDYHLEVIPLEEGYRFNFAEAYPSVGPTVTVVNQDISEESETVVGRGIQLYEFDALNMQDLYIPAGTTLVYTADTTNGYFGYDPASILDSFQEVMEHIEERFLFRNWQFVDTGFRDDMLERYKRYRELQLQLNNTEGANLEFGMEFQLDGQHRVSFYHYETEHVIDANDPNYGLLYVQGTPYMNLPLEYIGTPNETYLGPGSNAWILNQSLFPEMSLWKVRAPVSGKGAAPRLRLLSRNVHRFELMSINWIYRVMNAR